jgi:hypothetical protein
LKKNRKKPSCFVAFISVAGLFMSYLVHVTESILLCNSTGSFKVILY